MPGLKNNFQKSEALIVLHDDVKGPMYADIFNCQLGYWPIRYLGVRVGGSRLHVIGWVPDEENVQKIGWLGIWNSNPWW